MPREFDVFRAALKASPEMEQKLYEMAIDGKLAPLTEADKDDLLTVVATDSHCGIEGSKQALCECGIRVWLSPSTQEMLKERGVAPTVIVCTACFVRECETRREAPSA